MVNDRDALRKPWVVDVDGILVDPGQLRRVCRKLIDILDEVWKSGLAPQVFGQNLEAVAVTVVGIHQMVDQAERYRALKGGNLIEIRFPELPEPKVQQLKVVKALWLPESAN